tara:strand:+ start:187 stop:384 length:198 start_codon:yes stop_codon:yes gene_type:complete
MNQVLRKKLINPIIINKAIMPVELPKENIIRTIIEIPPPYCRICNKYLNDFTCNKTLKPNNCPIN